MITYLLHRTSVHEVVGRVLYVLVIEAEVDQDGYGGRNAVVDGVSEHRHVELVGGGARAPERPCKRKGALCIHIHTPACGLNSTRRLHIGLGLRSSFAPNSASTNAKSKGFLFNNAVDADVTLYSSPPWHLATWCRPMSSASKQYELLT